jgi:hypothetical protein
VERYHVVLGFAGGYGEKLADAGEGGEEGPRILAEGSGIATTEEVDDQN